LTADLVSLRPAFDGLILYGYDRNVTPTVLSEMRRLKYRAVMLGIWDLKSREEILAVAALADAYAGELAVSIAVGNEGLAFNRYTFDDVLRAAALIKERLRHPEAVALCTSEPFSEYGWAPLRGFGDFLAPNIHPVFDQPSFGPSDAVGWVRERALALAETAGKPLLVKETGFPHGGRFTPALQAQFWAAYIKGDALVHSRQDRGLWVSHASAFEAFDLPWKAEQSGIPIEDSWGLMSPARAPYPAFFVWEARQKARMQR
jgi:exo-beta-1,3-glucanase (GH17 family)